MRNMNLALVSGLLGQLSARFPILSRLWLFVAILMCAPMYAGATHITGADLTYECINPATSTYRITLTLYRDCENGQAAFDPNITLFFFRGLTGSLYTTQTVALPNNGVEIIPAFWNACTGQPYTICVEYARYTTIINLPPQFGGYNIGWARCCRNNTITNISGNQGITVIARVPGSEVPGCNSMPVFNQLPPLFLCVNQPFTFDHSATDADGDSLVYKISNPFTGTTTTGVGATQFNPVVNAGGFGNPMGPPPYANVNFLPGYNFTDPFGSGNFNIDPQSGSLTLTPTQIGVSVFAVSVCEYRNGVLLSENKRDFQINVVPCQPQGGTPVVGTTLPAGSSGDTIFVKPQESFCYDITVSDPAPGDTVILYPLSAAFGIGGAAPQPFATLNFVGTNPATGQVCWAPPCAYAGDTVLLIVGGRDTTDCPGYNLTFDTTYVVVEAISKPVVSHSLPGGGDTITVNANQQVCVDIGATDLDPTDTLSFFAFAGPFAALGGSATFANVTGLNPIDGDICWTPACTDAGQTFNLVFGAEDINSCMLKGFDTVTVVVNPLTAIDAGIATDICSGENLQLQATGGTAYAWTPTAGLSSTTVANPIASPADTTLYFVTITDPIGCPRIDSVLLPVWPLPVAFAGNDTVNCPGASVQLQATGGISYAWTPATGLSSTTIANPLAGPIAPTTYTLTVTDANGCQDTDDILITPMDAVAGPDQTICAGGSTPITASGGVIYSWDNAATLSNPNLATPTASPLVTTTYTVTVTDSYGCTDTDQLTVIVNPLPNADAGPNPAVCIGNSTQLAATGGTIYAWQPDPALSALNVSNPIATPTTTTTFYVDVTDGNGCTASDSVMVVVNALPVVSAGADTTKCGDTGVLLNASGGIGYAWSPATGLSSTAIANPVANPAVATLYTVTVTDVNGCVSSDQVQVATLYADAGPDDTICLGEVAQLQAVTGAGTTHSWDNAATLNNANIANPTAIPLATTLYTMTTTFFAGCTDTDTARVVVNALPNIDAGPNTPLCMGDSINLLATGGVSYAWNADPALSGTSLSNPLVFPLSTQFFYVAGTDANGCVNLDSVQIQVNPLPLVDAGNDTTKCGNVGVQLSASGGVSYTWLAPITGLSDPLIANPVANPDSSTTYYVSVTDANGCTNTDSVFVRVMYADAGPDVPVCIFDSVQLQAANGVAYQWDASPLLINGNTATPTVFPQVDTDFYVTVTDTSGCIDRDTVRVLVNPLPTTTATTTDPWVCSGGATIFNATGGVTYAWMPGSVFADSTQASATAFPPFVSNSGALDTTLTFYVEVTDANGCSNLDSLQQVVRVLPLVTTSNDTVRCPGATVPLFATGGIQYQWFPATALSDPTIANPIASPDTTTIYNVAVTAVWGCTDTMQVEVIVINPDAGADVTICAEDSIQLNAGGGVAYVWDNAATLSNPNIANPLAFPLTTTQYIVTVTDSLGCVDTDTLTVFVNALPPADAGIDTAVCIGLSVPLTATGGLSYQWLPADSLSDPLIANPIANPVLSTTYTVAVTDVNGCVATDSVVVTVNPLPLADAGPDLVKCGVDSIQIQATGGTSYTWSPATDLSDPLIANPMAAPDSNSIYIVTVTDANGCVNEDTLAITTMYAQTSLGDTICEGESVQLMASSLGGTPVAYSWTPTASLTDPAVFNPVASPTVTTDYLVTITDVSGCADTSSVQVFVNAAPPADAGADVAICIGSSTQLAASGGTTYSWAPATSLSDPNLADPVANPDADILYVVTVTDLNGCTANDSVQVSVNPLPVVDAGADQVICRSDGALLTATGAATYVWSPTAGLSDPLAADPIANPAATTTYLVTGTDANGCVNTDEVLVTITPLPVIEGDQPPAICLGQSVSLSVSGGQEYTWSTGQGGSTITVSPANTSIFWVIPVDNGCTGDTAFFEVEVERNLPRANFTPTVSEGFVPLDVVFENTSENASIYFWDFGDGQTTEDPNPLHTYDLPGQYTVTLIADNEIGCPNEFAFDFIDVLNLQVFFPNAFSPNGDGHNDEFLISANGVASMQVQIFNRWGQLVFESTDVNFRWDGRDQRGGDVQEGVYVYRFVATSYKGEQVERGGSITLVR